MDPGFIDVINSVYKALENQKISKELIDNFYEICANRNKLP